jgi:hypothetical protein
VIAAAGAAATVTVSGAVVEPAPEAPRRWTGKTRWIGHC